MWPRPSSASSRFTLSNGRKRNVCSILIAASASHPSKPACTPKTMRQIIKQREIVGDPWKYADEDVAADAVILPLARFLVERDAWLSSGKKLGVRIGPADSVETLASDLSKL